MINIKSEIIKKQNNFWNHCLFHPTDAIEDPWGKRIIDRMAEDGSIKTIRFYSMFEDIVYTDESGKLLYDFRINDLRLDYMVEKGFDILLAYGSIPPCISADPTDTTSVSKNKTRYKGKMWYAAPPKDYALWEEICYEYTRHITERYGIETVSRWQIQCFNEPDIPQFFLNTLPRDEHFAVQKRIEEYNKLYTAFEHGIRRVSDKIKIGGPALAGIHDFLGAFLDHVKENDLKLDFISLHNYGTDPKNLNTGVERIDLNNNIRKQIEYDELIRAHGFEDTELVVDEWGMASNGFYNIEECPSFICRETEVFSSYFAKLICEYIRHGFKMSKMLICLSGQHEMVVDFSGFRNFFTLNFIKKPIYNAYIMASWLGEGLLGEEHENKNLYVVPTKKDNGSMAVLLTYSADDFSEDIPSITEKIHFDEDITSKTVNIFCIDKENTNPYNLYKKMGIETPNEDDLKLLREEGNLKPMSTFKAYKQSDISLNLTPNSTFLITIE